MANRLSPGAKAGLVAVGFLLVVFCVVNTSNSLVDLRVYLCLFGIAAALGWGMYLQDRVDLKTTWPEKELENAEAVSPEPQPAMTEARAPEPQLLSKTQAQRMRARILAADREWQRENPETAARLKEPLPEAALEEIRRAEFAERFSKALTYAAEAHVQQVRKGTNTPYLAHLLATASLVLENGGDEEEAVAALLHDAVEDQGGRPRLEDIRKRFGGQVAEIVDGCTDSGTWANPLPEWRERKESYVRHLREASRSVRLVAAADKLHNLRSIATDYRQVGEALWKRFSGHREGVLWYYRAVSEALAGNGRTEPLVQELQELLEGLVLATAKADTLAGFGCSKCRSVPSSDQPSAIVPVRLLLDSSHSSFELCQCQDCGQDYLKQFHEILFDETDDIWVRWTPLTTEEREGIDLVYPPNATIDSGEARGRLWSRLADLMLRRGRLVEDPEGHFYWSSTGLDPGDMYPPG